jgi:hypothetical protein
MSRRRPPAAPGPRTVEVDPERVPRWVDGFAERHGDPDWSTAPDDPSVLRLTAPDGAVAELHPWPGGGGPVPADRSGLTTWVTPPRRTGLVLVRRGGYAVGLAEDGRLTVHRTGTRYVQSRTAAGGWSQQRYARRRGNQADALVATVADRVVDLVLPGAPEALVLGGDRALAGQVLTDARLAALASLPRRELYDLPDPRLAVLEQAVRRARAVRVVVAEP